MQHPDEGTIHAWLDGALPSDEARAMTEHVATCSACADAVAEARGLLAASSRILSALDAVPGGVLPASDTFEEARPARPARPARRPMRASRWQGTPWRVAAAIVVVGSVGWLASRSRNVQKASDLPNGATTTEARDVMALDSAPAPVVAQAAPVAGSMRVAAPVVPPGEQPGVGSTASRVAPGGARPPAPTAPARERRDATAEREAKTIVAQSGQVADAALSANTAQLQASAPPPATTAGAGSAGAGSASKYATAIGSAASRAEAATSDALESRRKAAAPTLMGRTSGAVAAPAPMAALMPGGDALQRLAGCYALTTSTWSRGIQRDESLRAPLPARLELLTTPAATGASELAIRSAAGTPPLAADSRGSWRPLGADEVFVQIGDDKSTVRLTLTVAGDTVSGRARLERAGVSGWTAQVIGRKESCAAP